MNFPILETYGKSSGLDYDFRPYYKGIEGETIESMLRRYGAQIYSRLEGEYLPLPFTGTDIRRLQRTKKPERNACNPSGIAL